MSFVHLHRHKFDVVEGSLATPCWIWNNQILHGYAYSTTLGGRVHIAFYKTLIGPIQKDFVLHHICENKACINPDHMQSMTQKDHNRLHKLGTKMNLSDEEINRRKLHGKEMIHHAQEKSYSKRTRQEVAKEMWSNRTPEQRREVGRKISAAKRGDA